MKYNTISTSSLTSEGRKSSNLTIYADMNLIDNQMTEKHTEIASVRGELEIVQKALKVQTRRCRQLVTEYTKRLQQKEQQYQGEKTLREDQLGKVLRALLVFEARLRQEQKFISHQLEEKDCIIRKQNSHIKKLMSSSQYCKNCNQYYSPSPNLESLDSSSEYVATDYHDYQSSNFESLDSSSEIYATISEKSYSTEKSFNNSCSGDEIFKTGPDCPRNIYQKNKLKDSIGRRNKKIPHRKSVGTYFEVLKLRNDSPCSNEDNTSNDYDNLDSLPTESATDKISIISGRIENMFQYSQQDSPTSHNSTDNLSLSDCHTTVINKNETIENNSISSNDQNEVDEKVTTEIEEEHEEENSIERGESKLSESIPPFDGDGDTNDKWYASASDQEDEEHRDVYRNNPVLECVNQILLQNMNDNLNSPPKTPAIERKNLKNKRVKFSDEEDNKVTENILTQDKLLVNAPEIESQDYYETPIQKSPNIYESPQSIYSNDYEQILSRSSDSFPVTTANKLENKQEKEINNMSSKKLSMPKCTLDTPDKTSHYYIDMDTKSENEEQDNKISRKSKIFRTPPALPPKPANLISKNKVTNLPGVLTRRKSVEQLDSEPDYCSISELNLPTNKNISGKKISVVAEINPLNSNEVKHKLEKAALLDTKAVLTPDYDPVVVSDGVPNLIDRSVEKLNIQIAKQTFIKPDKPQVVQSHKSKEPEIPKLPQVSEIIIPEENEEDSTEEKKEERISLDNYVQNNSQILKLKSSFSENRTPIRMGSSVSRLISGFNKKQIPADMSRRAESRLDATNMFLSFENIQNLDKHSSMRCEKSNDSHSFDQFDLSQNFEEFKLDDCEIEEYNVDMCDITEEEIRNDIKLVEEKLATVDKKTNTTYVVGTEDAPDDLIIPGLNKNSVELLKKHLQKANLSPELAFQPSPPQKGNEPTYEHFLECTGLSSKSILTPSRLLSNHKHMLKPKDIKLRSSSRVRANNFIERHSLGNNVTTTTKYWSEPYI